MKLKGSFVLREVMGEIVAIPVGESLLNFNGMICLNAVGYVIWNGLQAEKSKDQLLSDILEKFEVSPQEATADLEEFLLHLQESGLLEE